MEKKGRYVIVRTYSAGVFAGTLVSRKGQGVVLKDARRLWYWKGAASLSQLAVDQRVELLQVIEILGVSERARKFQCKQCERMVKVGDAIITGESSWKCPFCGVEQE